MSTRTATDRRNDETGFTIIELLVVTGVIAVLVAIAVSAGYYAFDAARLGRSVADMRSISEAIARYKLDYASIPAGSLQPVSDISATLQLVTRDVPFEDAWGNSFYYEEVTVDGVPTYRLYCYGKDGAPDGAITGNWIDFYSDTVVEGGTFIQTKY
jgi:prepilin-type N-terminal cleavage/methylation domain-containing protein